MENCPHRILIIDTAWIGDVIFTTSLIGTVRRLWPEAQIHVLVAPRGQTLLEDNPFIDKIRVYDKHKTQKSVRSLFSLGKDLKRTGFDLILNAHPSFRSRLLTKLTGSPVRVGYRGFGCRFFQTHSIANDLALEPDHVERRINLLRALGRNCLASPLFFHTSEKNKNWANDYLVNTKGPLLGLVAGSAWNTKRWPLENYHLLAQQWIEDKGGSVLIFGGLKEQELVQHICTSDGTKAVINEPLPRVGALLEKCEVVVGNDTGITLLAVATGGPRVLTLYGCTQVNYHFPEPHRAISAGVPCCLPRTGHGSQKCKWMNGEPWCMKQITVERIWKEIQGK